MSVILRTATRFTMPLLLLFSVFLLLRGHNLPGGGFIGGLVGASAFALYSLAFDVASAERALRVHVRSLVAAGLITALTAAALPLIWNLPLLTHRYSWTELRVFGFGELPLGTPFLFDVGVYLTVVGVSLTIIFSLAEE
jgi:multicomponent Na+:H+ antiporter subunit B